MGAGRVVADRVFREDERRQAGPRQGVPQQPRLGPANAQMKQGRVRPGVDEVASIRAAHRPAQPDELRPGAGARVEAPRDDTDAYPAGERRPERTQVARMRPAARVEQRAGEIDRDGPRAAEAVMAAYTETLRCVRERHSYFTVPSTSANSVKSFPRPTFRPGWIDEPTCRTSTLPAVTRSPPYTLTPRFCELESRPLRVLPAPFL